MTKNLNPCSTVPPPSPFASQYTNACHNAKILFATDEWFATADNILKESSPVFDLESFCEQGKVMDGWETRRRREEGHDWCLIQLADRADVLAVEIDTAHFTGNQTPLVSLMVADITDGDLERKMVHEIPGILDRFLFGPSRGTGATPDEVRQAEQAVSQHGVSWKTLLPKTPLRPGYQETRMHYFTLDEPTTGTHVRVNYYPDGGVARLRLWGDSTARETLRRQLSPMYSSVVRSSACTLVSHSQDDSLPSRQPFEFPELSSSLFGGIGLACSNQHYGHPSNLIQPSLGKDMGDGWETARHPNRPDVWTKNKETGLLDSPLMDWCILKLGSVARDGIERIILDTKHFRGNYPESVRVEGCSVESDDSLDVATPWFPLIPRCRMTPDSEHVFDRHQIANNDRVVSHVKVSIFPDGGLSRVRVYAAPDSLG